MRSGLPRKSPKEGVILKTRGREFHKVSATAEKVPFLQLPFAPPKVGTCKRPSWGTKAMSWIGQK